MERGHADIAAGLEIRELAEIPDLRLMEALFAKIWVRDGPPPIGADILRAFAHAGCYVAGAFQGGRLAGGLVGFLAMDQGDPLHLHSHILGVDPTLQAHGVGRALKLHQRDWALARGLEEIRWTFDPLVRRNARFNLAKLGAELLDYRVDFYGAMGDAINRDGASDRAVVAWRLDSARAQQAAADGLAEPDVDGLLKAGAGVTLRVGEDGGPVREEAGDRVLLCQVPADIVSLRIQQPKMATAWRLALRETLGRALAEGFEATAMSDDGWYVLTRGEKG